MPESYTTYSHPLEVISQDKYGFLQVPIKVMKRHRLIYRGLGDTNYTVETSAGKRECLGTADLETAQRLPDAQKRGCPPNGKESANRADSSSTRQPNFENPHLATGH